jgi:hypothetical protein
MADRTGEEASTTRGRRADTDPQVHKSTYIGYLEYHSVCLIVVIGTPHPLYRKRVCPPSLEPQGGGAQAHSPTYCKVYGIQLLKVCKKRRVQIREPA